MSGDAPRPIQPSTRGEPAAPPRVVFVVARGRERLYTELTVSFADAEEVTVMVDRRVRERRTSSSTAARERRRADRRVRKDVLEHLRDLGWALVPQDA